MGIGAVRGVHDIVFTYLADCGESFVDHFKLANVNSPPQPDKNYEERHQKKNIYLLPYVQKITPTGVTGGPNFGVLTKIPVLVN